MFRFGNQKAFEIGKVNIGGEPGDNPTVLIGSIFYGKHKIVEDEKKGIFDKEKAEKLIKEQEELSDKTGNPGLVDVVGMSEEAIRGYMEFVADVTDKPFLVDSAIADIKIAAVEYAKEVGLEKRIIYNSISPESKDKEIEALKNSNIEAAVVLAYTFNVTSSKARIDALEKVLPKLEEAGITKPLIDTFVMDVPSLPAAAKAAMEIKKKYGFPCGSGAHNAIASWKGFKNMLGKEAEKPAVLMANTLQIVLGSDFVLYGPIEDSKLVFPAVFTIDTAYRYFARTKDLIEI
ncbi:MAG TPA: tetrahydromethanopterin S-methyltransferase subunit H [Methermicoccus shengliensis]|uniref:Tetrahydromethanopterin S-methyltransferase subunit H n=1 Tax=Methermicoccus shengliensis TaxID=660064 RepID=A0A832VZ83_9EURY|nr:MAG: N5-methyltetrahydromethanopterin:coenzyme M methyltransferase (Mtr) (Methanobacterium thermoautotro) [Euryarchaeota archaeon 55_53]KUK30706.1 MAG: N5-methyltetrahydromethanopterin:coenzyme M methyltransferase (Mtr) (Methanobacterium thermoautotro) [Methanosarcinales archeaon 56_1174]MDI3487300.1 tetrahydromethanopterin S-methyltransferase subunit [Methanosarcinales archaeon]MDN5294626.1 tetrahydromethanopterin S-methyltransferase subunit [Methanosarcinales archaeon]HIH69334.1 tetrahydro